MDTLFRETLVYELQIYQNFVEFYVLRVFKTSCAPLTRKIGENHEN